MAMKLKIIIVFVLFAGIYRYAYALRKVRVTTKGNGIFKNLVSRGVVVAGKTSLVFSVKACTNAAVVLSNMQTITNTTGTYFVLILGSNQNQNVAAMDSCFDCQRQNITLHQVLNCAKRTHFWIRWDVKGFLEAGTGTSVGMDTLISLQGFRARYNLFVCSVTSTMNSKAEWEFTQAETPMTFFVIAEAPITFFRPVPGGGTSVEVREAAPIGRTVMDIIIKQSSSGIQFTLSGSSSNFFSVDGHAIKLAKKLDYEEKQFHILTIGTNVGISTSMVVIVTDVLDESPQVTTNGVLEIPEEMPIGTIVGWNLRVTDADRNDSMSYKLEGPLSEMLMALPNGKVKILKRIDREKMDSSLMTTQLSLTVTDRASNEGVVNVTVKIMDVNDNVPTFEKNVYETNAVENMTSDTLLVTLNCTDNDEGKNGVFNMSIVQRKSASSFYLAGSSLYVKSGELDYETSPGHIASVQIQAVDQSELGVVHTGVATVVIQILPRDEYTPQWISPLIDKKGNFPEVVMTSSSPIGSTVGVYHADDNDAGETVIYALQTADRLDFVLNNYTGQLTTRADLSDPSYNVVVTAKKGNYTLEGKLSIKVKKPSQAHAPAIVKFDKPVYVINLPLPRDQATVLAYIHVTIPDTGRIATATLDNAGSEVYSLSGNHSGLRLNIRSKFANESTISIPTICEITIYIRNTTHKDVSYIVVNSTLHMDEPVSTTSSTSTTTTATPLSTLTTTLIPTTLTSTTRTPTETSNRASTPTPTKTSNRASTQTRTWTSTQMSTTPCPTLSTVFIPLSTYLDITTSSTRRKPTSTSTYSTSMLFTHAFTDTSRRNACPPSERTERIAYVAVIVFLGAALLGLIGFIYFSTKPRKKDNAVAPERRDPLGCSEINSAYDQVDEGNCKQHSLQCQSETILEIADETIERKYINMKLVSSTKEIRLGPTRKVSAMDTNGSVDICGSSEEIVGNGMSHKDTKALKPHQESDVQEITHEYIVMQNAEDTNERLLSKLASTSRASSDYSHNIGNVDEFTPADTTGLRGASCCSTRLGVAGTDGEDSFNIEARTKTVEHDFHFCDVVVASTELRMNTDEFTQADTTGLRGASCCSTRMGVAGTDGEDSFNIEARAKTVEHDDFHLCDVVVASTKLRTNTDAISAENILPASETAIQSVRFSEDDDFEYTMSKMVEDNTPEYLSATGEYRDSMAGTLVPDDEHRVCASPVTLVDLNNRAAVLHDAIHHGHPQMDIASLSHVQLPVVTYDPIQPPLSTIMPVNKCPTNENSMHRDKNCEYNKSDGEKRAISCNDVDTNYYVKDVRVDGSATTYAATGFNAASTLEAVTGLDANGEAPEPGIKEKKKKKKKKKGTKKASKTKTGKN